MSFLTQLGALALCALSAWVVMHPRIHEGLVTRLGLICFSIGMLLTAAGGGDHRAIAAVVLGLLLAVAGVSWRLWRDPAAREAAAHVSGYGSLT
jgi:hypothetical protein